MIIATGNLDGQFTSDELLDKESTIVLKLNGQDRFAEQELTYFTRYQTMKYHTSIPSTIMQDTIGVLQFCSKSRRTPTKWNL